MSRPQRSYGALRSIAGCLRILAYITFIIGAIAAVVVIVNENSNSNVGGGGTAIVVALGALPSAGIYGVILPRGCRADLSRPRRLRATHVGQPPPWSTSSLERNQRRRPSYPPADWARWKPVDQMGARYLRISQRFNSALRREGPRESSLAGGHPDPSSHLRADGNGRRLHSGLYDALSRASPPPPIPDRPPVLPIRLVPWERFQPLRWRSESPRSRRNSHRRRSRRRRSGRWPCLS